MPQRRSKQSDYRDESVDPVEAARLRRRKKLLVCITAIAVLLIVAAGGLWWRSARYERQLAANLDTGYAALEAGNYNDALINIGPWLNANADDADAMFAYARAREEVEEPREKHLGEAVGWYRKIRSDFPGHAKAVEAEPRMLALMVRLELWGEILNETAAIRPEQVQPSDERALRGLRSRGVALSREGRSADAIAALRRYVEIRPLDADMQVMLLALENAAGEIEVSTQRVEALREAHGDDPRALVTASSLASLSGDHEQAGALAKEALEKLLASDDGGIALVKAQENDGFVGRLVGAMDAVGDTEAANDALAALAKATGELQLQRYAANRLLQTAHFDAVLAMTADLDVTGGDGELLGLRGIALREAGLVDEAAKLAEVLAGREEHSRGWGFARVIPWWRPIESVILASTPVTRVHDAGLRSRAATEALEAYGHPVFLVVLGEALADADEPHAAMMIFAQASSSTGNVWDRPLLELAITAAATGRPREASAALGAVIGRESNSVEGASAVAALVGSRDNPAEARPLLEQFEGQESPWLDIARAVANGEWAEVDVDAIPVEMIPAAFDLATRTGASDVALLIARSAAERASRGEIDPPTATLMVVIASGANAPTPTTPLPTAPPGEFAKDLFLLARSDREKAAAALRAGLNNAIEGQSADATNNRLVELGRIAWEFNLLATHEEADWKLLRQSAAAMVEVAGDYGERWKTRLALLDLNPPARNADQAQLRENALSLGAVVRRYPQLPGPRLTLVRTLDALGMTTDARDQLAAGVEAAPGDATLRLALIERIGSVGEDVGPHLRVLERIADEGGLTPAQRQSAAQAFIAAGQDERAAGLLPDVSAEAADISSLNLLRRTGRLDAADLKVLAQSTDPGRILFAIDTYRLNGQTDLADAALNHLDALAEAGTIPQPLAAQARARHLLRVGQTSQALALAMQVTQADPSQLDAWRLMVSGTLAESGLMASAEMADRAAASPAANDAGIKSGFTEFARAARRLHQAIGIDAQPGDDPTVATQMPQIGGLLGDLLTDEAAAAPNVAKSLADAVALLLDARKTDRPIAEVGVELAALAEGVKWSSTLQMLTAQVQLLSGDSVGAAERALQQMRLRPRDPQAAQLAVDALAAAGRNDDAIDAVQEWQRRLRLGSAEVALLESADLTLAKLYLRTNRAGQVLEVIQPFLREAGPRSPEARALAAEAHLALGQSDRALAVLRPLVTSEMNLAQDPVARLWVASARLSIINGQGGSADGVDALRLVTPTGPALDEASWQSLMQLAEAWSFAHSRRSGGESAAQHEIDAQASAVIHRAIAGLKTDPNAPPLAWEQIGVTVDQIDDRNAAEAAYRAALATDSSRIVAGNNLAMLLIRAVEEEGGGHDDPRLAVALALAQAVVANERVRETSTYPALLDTLGAVQAAQGNFDQALATLADVVARAPQEPEWVLHAAEVQYASGDLTAARKTRDQLDRLLSGTRPTPLLRERYDALTASLRE